MHICFIIVLDTLYSCTYPTARSDLLHKHCPRLANPVSIRFRICEVTRNVRKEAVEVEPGGGEAGARSFHAPGALHACSK